MTERKEPFGRPVKHKDPAEVEKVIEKYFKECEKKDKPPVMTGVALALGITRQSLVNYSKKQDFFDTIQNAKQRVELYAEEQLYRTQGTVKGVEFSLKNNFAGWRDETINRVGNVGGETFNTSDLSDEELNARLAKFTRDE